VGDLQRPLKTSGASAPDMRNPAAQAEHALAVRRTRERQHVAEAAVQSAQVLPCGIDDARVIAARKNLGAVGRKSQARNLVTMGGILSQLNAAHDVHYANQLVAAACGNTAVVR